MSWQEILVAGGLVAAAINAGAFFAFSNFVMSALGQLPSADGALAMQEINRAAPNALFVAAIVGAGPLGVAQLFAESSAALWLAVVLSVGSFLVTILGNVAMNNRLDGDVNYWPVYLVSWTRLNSVRTATSAGSVIAYGLAL